MKIWAAARLWLRLHGYPFDRSMWREQIDFLSTHGYPVVAPDLRVFGEMSDKLWFVDDVEGSETDRQAEACRTIITMARHESANKRYLSSNLRLRFYFYLSDPFGLAPGLRKA